MKLKPLPEPTEHQIQKALMDWTEWESSKYPELKLLFAVPNGGVRHIGTAQKLKREGVKSGVPDLFLPVPKGDYHGLFLELKRKGGRLSAEQRDWLGNLQAQGYKAACAFGLESAINIIKTYLEAKDEL